MLSPYFLTHTVQMKHIIEKDNHKIAVFLLNPHGSDETYYGIKAI